MENQKKVWRTKEFRDAKKNFKLADKCNQCGSKENLTPHHQVSFHSLLYYKHRELGISELCKIKGVTFFPSSITNAGGIQTSKGYIKAQELKDFIGQHPEFKQISEEMAKKEYYSFNNIQTLCKRCHFAHEKGMTLCCICKKKYHYRNFDSCKDCQGEFDRGYKEFEDHMKQIEGGMV